MAHFAQLDDNNVVLQVIVVHNNELMVDGIESEAKGIAFCQSLLGGNWIQTSYNHSIRKNYAGIGFTYDRVRDAFIPTKLFASWLLNEDTCRWESPVAYPTDNQLYTWDETIQNWALIQGA